ncbi:MAG: hypothetical protein Tsb0010_11170 [Parvularculaceae bacterium]
MTAIDENGANAPDDKTILPAGVSAIDIALFLIAAGALYAAEIAIAPPPLYSGFIGIIGSFLAVFAIMKLRGQRFSDLGLRRPRRIILLPLWVVAIFVVTFAVALGGQLIAAQFIGGAPDVSKFAPLYQNLPLFLVSLVSIWVTAAFFEEIVYRGFLLGRLLNIIGDGLGPAIVATLLHAVMFGALHAYQGLLGVIATGLVAVVFGVFFYLQQRNLWALIIVHGLIDTLSLIQFYLIGVPAAAQ